MAGRDIKAGRAFVELGINDRMAAGLNAASRRLRAFGGSLRNIGAVAFGAGAAALAPLVASVRKYVTYGDQLHKMSLRTGVAVEALSKLSYAAGRSGTSLETIEAGMRNMARAVMDARSGLLETQRALGWVGVSLDDLDGLAPDELFARLGDAIGKTADPVLRTAAAMKLFGKAGTALLPVFEDGGKSLAELIAHAERYGLVVTDLEARGAAMLNDALGTLWETVRRLAVSVGDALAPSLSAVVDTVRRGVRWVSDFVREHRDLVVVAATAAAGVMGVGVSLLASGMAIQVAGFALGGLASALLAVKAAAVMIVSPIGLVTAAVVGLTVVFRSHIPAIGGLVEWLGDCFLWLQERVRTVLGGIRAAFEAGDLALAAQVAWLGVKVAALSAVQAIADRWVEFKVFALVAIVDLAGRLERQWERISYSFKHLWTDLKYWFARIALEIAGAWSKAWQNVWAYWTDKILGSKIFQVLTVGRTLTPEEVAYAREQNAVIRDDGLGAVEADKAAALTELDRKHVESLGALGTAHIKHMAELKAAVELTGDAAAMAAGADEIGKANVALEEARRALADAISAAHRAAAGASPGAPGAGDSGFPDAAEIQQRYAAVGTFNPAAVWGLGAQGVWQRIAKATEETAQNTQQGGGRFQP